MARRRRGRMIKLVEKEITKINVELADEEVKLLLETSIDWEELRPKVTNAALYDELISVVNEANQSNENIAQLKDRLKQLGEEGLILANKVVQLLS